MFGKYTFSEGAVRGLGLGAGMRYSSKTVISRSVDWNPLAGGYQAGDAMVFDVTASYPWTASGFRFYTMFGLYNLTDKQYADGSYVQAPARNWVLSNTLQF